LRLPWPVPSQVGQTRGTVPALAPVPLQVWHGPSPASFSETVTPLTASLKLSDVSVSRSWPRLGRCWVVVRPPGAQALEALESLGRLGERTPPDGFLSAMTDIFISYSKADHTLALKLSAFLEAEGWSVWWDRNLSAGEVYRDEIMRELSAARAVIVIWTQTSIKSDWARAEAGRAKAEGKLIPVKTPGLTYSDIPLPFGEMHTENLTATDLIRAAVVAQLSKPAVAPSPLWLAARAVRLQFLTWTGIIGGAVTIFSSLRGLLNLTDWARWIVSHWHEWTHTFWAAALSSVGLHVHPAFAPSLSFTVFLVMVVVGTVLRSKTPAYPGGRVEMWRGGCRSNISVVRLFRLAVP